MMADEIEQLTKKRKVMSEAMEGMEKEAEKLYEKAEKTGQMKFVVNANCLKKSVKEKELLLHKVDVIIKEKKDLLKSTM